MHILEDHQDRSLLDNASICVVRASKVFCRRCCGVSSSVRIASIVRQRQHFGKQRGDLGAV